LVALLALAVGSSVCADAKHKPTPMRALDHSWDFAAQCPVTGLIAAVQTTDASELPPVVHVLLCPRYSGEPVADVDGTYKVLNALNTVVAA
jgi:hypothetical protein